MLVPPLGALPSLTECRGRVDAAGIGEAILDGAPGGAAGHIPQRVVYDDPRPPAQRAEICQLLLVSHALAKDAGDQRSRKEAWCRRRVAGPDGCRVLLPGSLPVRLQAQEEG